MFRNSKPYIGFNDRWVRIIAMPAIGLLIIVGLLPMGNGNTWLDFSISWAVSTFFSMCYWEGTRTYTLAIWERFPKVKDVRKRLIWQLFCFIIYGFVVTIVLKYLVAFLLQGNTTPRFHTHDFAVSYLLTFAGVGSYEALRFFHQLRHASIEKERYKQQVISAELEGLRAQVNPHFLFNSLNTLTYLIPENSERAVRFVRQLSKTYRYLLETNQEPLILLQKELDFLEAYVFLLKERFEDNLEVNIQISDDFLSQYIVPLSSQLLIENAIKHNIVSDHKPLTINILIKGNYLIIKNNLQLKTQVNTSTKMGLANIKKRYAHLTDKVVEIVETQDEFIVKLPLLNLPKTV